MLRKILTTFLIIYSTLTLCACNRNSNNSAKDIKQLKLTEKQEANIQLEVKKATVEEMDIEIKIPAQFKARNQAVDRIYTPVNGKVNKIFVQPGDTIKIGQDLVQIKSDEIGQIQFAFLEKVMQIDSDIAQAKTQLELSTKIYKREKHLYDEKITSLAEFEVAKAQYEKDKSKLNALEIEKSAATKVYQQRLSVFGSAGSIENILKTKQIYPFVTLKASKTGILLERKINEGEFVQKDEELFSLADLSTIWLVGYAFEKDSSILHIGEEVYATLSDDTNKKIEGVLSYVSPILDNDSKTLEVRSDIKNKDLSIKPNMYAEMYVKTDKAKGLMVSNEAIEKYGDYAFVFVKIAPHTYEQRKVEIGRKNQQYSEILSGIEEGEEYVTRGSFEVLGQFIKMQES